MTFRDIQAPIRQVRSSIIAGIALFITAAFSIGGLNLFGARVGFGFVPLIIIAIWPRYANTLASLALVFSAGLFMDWASGGIVGQSSLVFVLAWGFLRPEMRNDSFSPVTLFFVWLATCGLALVIHSLSGYFVVRIWPDFLSLGWQILFATCLLPIFMLLRSGLAVLVNDSEDWG